MNRILTEPLFQFLLIGLIIFMLDAFVSKNQEELSTITINDSQLQELIDIFVNGQGRQPTATEIDNLIVKWTQNEILYREAQKMGLAKGDEMIRSRLVLKMQNILYNSVTQNPPTDEDLTQFFAEYRENYDTPAKYTIEQFFFAKNTPEAKEAALQMVKDLASSSAPEEYAKQVRVFARRPSASLRGLFEIDSIQDLVNADLNQWQLAQSSKGIHLARVTEVLPAQVAQLGDIKNRVIKDWKQYSSDLQLMQQTTEIANRYTIDITAQAIKNSANDNEYQPESPNDGASKVSEESPGQ